MSDLIKRKSIRNMYSCLNPNDRVLVGQVLIDIDAIPSAEVPTTMTGVIDAIREAEYRGYMKAVEDRPKGEWIKEHGVVNCSNCNHSHWSDCYEDTVVRFNFCPNCGADMRERESE